LQSVILSRKENNPAIKENSKLVLVSQIKGFRRKKINISNSR
jgi:hypothetical protein